MTPEEEAIEKKRAELTAALRKLPDKDDVSNLVKIENPPEVQQKKLALLMSTLEKLTGIQVNNTTFIYRGDGSLGINLGGYAIGFHEQVFAPNISFEEVLEIACHEVAHNYNLFAGHKAPWQHAFQVLNAKVHSTLFSIMRKQAAGQPLTSYEAGILGAQEEWNNIK